MVESYVLWGKRKAGVFAVLPQTCAGYFVYPFQNEEINSHARNLKPSIWCGGWKEKELVEPSLPLLFWNG